MNRVLFKTITKTLSITKWIFFLKKAVKKTNFYFEYKLIILLHVYLQIDIWSSDAAIAAFFHLQLQK